MPYLFRNCVLQGSQVRGKTDAAFANWKKHSAAFAKLGARSECSANFPHFSRASWNVHP